MLWKLLERGGTQGIQFIVQLILARLLLPDDYGVIALVTVFITLANVFVQSGFNKALVQKKDADHKDFSSIFFFSVFVAVMLYILLFLLAPFISSFFNQPEFASVLRVLAIILFFGALNSIQEAYIAKHLLFKKLFISSSFAMALSGAAGIIAALAGWGVWALVLQQMINRFTICLILWFTVRWRPQWVFSFKRTKVLFAFGWKLLVSSLINALYQDLRSLVVGRIYSPATLGYFNRGQQFPKLIMTNVDGSIKTVMLPTFSHYQDDRSRLKAMVRRSIKISSFLLLPMMIGLAAVAEPVVLLILTDKWLPAVPFLQIFCLTYALAPIHSANLQAINAMGRSDIFLKLDILKKLIGLVILMISIRFGVHAIAFGSLFSSLISSFINARPNEKLLDYHYKEQLLDIAPSLGISLIMGTAVFLMHSLRIPIPLLLIMQVLSGCAIYIGLAKLLRLESLSYILATMGELGQEKRNSALNKSKR